LASNRTLVGGTRESQCGWLKDMFVVSWQVLPAALSEIFGDADPAMASRAMQAMLKMKKFNIAELQGA
jgi:predicted 3-demethylubiquinone-9 3-methyltransferase (glyoxalase superfamily)